LVDIRNITASVLCSERPLYI